MFVIDTSVLIPMRDDDPALMARVEALGRPLAMSVISLVELEGGADRKPEVARFRRARLERLKQGLITLEFAMPDAKVYGHIVATAGYSRRKLLDRMIAAQAIVSGATLVTLNPEDFADVPGLKVQAL